MMSKAMLGFVVAAVAMAGCCHKSCCNATAAPSGAKPVVLTDGTNTWRVGAVVMGGTNLPATNVTIGIRPSAGGK